jgi:P-type Cu2+ transporter
LHTQLTRAESDGTRCADLILDGVGCAACGWLIDRMLKREAGIVAVTVNVATARMRVRWRPGVVAFSKILNAIAELGFRPHPITAQAAIDTARAERHSALKRLAIAGFGMMQVMMFAVAMYTAGEQGMDAHIRNYLRIVSALCATPVMFYSGWPILVGAWYAIRARSVTMDVPVALGLILAYGTSVWATALQQGEVYFDSVVMFVFFLNTARFVEMLARHRSGNLTDALARLIPPTAHRVHNGVPSDVATTQLSVGDTLLIRVGETIPADARIISGKSVIDESMLTGESQGIHREVGDSVVAGTLNLNAPLTVVVTAIGSATVLSNIVRLLERASFEKAPLATMADRAAAMFLSRVLLSVIIVAVIWFFIDPHRVLPITLAMLVATCPCALSLATPTVLAAASAALARRGVLVVRTAALEVLPKITQVVFDKTGTLTQGRPTIQRCESLRATHSVATCRVVADALEAHSEHLIAHAFRKTDPNPRYMATDVVVTPGAGIEGVVDGKRYRIGQSAFAGVEGPSRSSTGDNAVWLSDDEGALAVFHLGDQLRDEAPQVITELRALKLPCRILSGDAEEPVAKIAGQCAIDTYHWRQTPANKLAMVHSLRASGEVVLMIGDGINDAPVLRGASASVAMARASALAQVSADIVLMGDTLTALPEAIHIAQRARSVIRQNLVWATCYNLVALSLAAFGLLPPWLAAVGMSLSSMLVVLNAWRLAPRKSVTPPRSSQELSLCPSSTT